MATIFRRSLTPRFPCVQVRHVLPDNGELRPMPSFFSIIILLDAFLPKNSPLNQGKPMLNQNHIGNGSGHH